MQSREKSGILAWISALDRRKRGAVGIKKREYQYDNLRFLLIALVVLGHLLEIAGDFPHRELLYELIYSFHMPAFLFLSGMFARFDRV